MEFHITMAGPLPDPGAVEDAIRDMDPAALADADPAGRMLRVATSVNAVELVALLNRAGFPVAPQQVEQLPSICCGGCSG